MSTVWTNLSGLEFSQRYVNAEGIRTRVIEAGNGEGDPLIFLHGTGGHAEAYSRNIKEHAKHFKVYVIDFVGHGYSDKPDVPYTIPVYADHVLKFMDALGIQKAHLSGESLGGWVSAWLAIHHPHRVAKLVLNTAGGLIADPKVMERLRTLTRQAVEQPTREFIKIRLEFLMLSKTSVTDELIDIRYEIYAQPEMRKAVENILVLQEMEVRVKNMLSEEDLAKITAPTFVIWTSHDPTAGIEVGERFAKAIPNARMKVIENAGHWPQYEQANEFNELHINFLNEGDR